MFSELPKLFDRNFVVGYLLTAAMFAIATYGLLEVLDAWPGLTETINKGLAEGTTILALASLLGAVLLLATNREIYRLMEGYGRFRPARLLSWIERRRYRKVCKELKELQRPHTGNKLTPPTDQARLEFLTRYMAERFPDDERWLLPTAFGNTVRAFEVYPRVMYGIEGVQGWACLLAVLPKEYRSLIDEAKAKTDFWVNLSLLSSLFVIEYGALLGYWSVRAGSLQLRSLWIPALAIGIKLVATARARSTAAQWGAYVKISFDVFLPTLWKKLGYPPRKNRAHERAVWTSFSQAIIYRLPESLP